MAMDQREIERKVQQLGNDVASIYEMLADIIATQAAHSERFVLIDGRLDGIDGRLDGIDGLLGEILTELRAR